MGFFNKRPKKEKVYSLCAKKEKGFNHYRLEPFSLPCHYFSLQTTISALLPLLRLIYNGLPSANWRLRKTIFAACSSASIR